MQFSRELAKLTVSLAKLAYDQPATIERELADLGLGELVHFDEPSTQAFLVHGGEGLYLSFRGSQEAADWLANAKFLPSINDLGARVHTGFVEALDEVWAEIEPLVAAARVPVTVTGHSLGAALASLAALRLFGAGHKVAAVYTYGQPRTGHASFGRIYDSALGSITYRLVNHIDLVTRVPLLIQGYRHVGRRMYFDASGTFHPDASGWRITLDDLSYRLTHLGRIKSIGIESHLIGRYMRLVESL